MPHALAVVDVNPLLAAVVLLAALLLALALEDIVEDPRDAAALLALLALMTIDVTKSSVYYTKKHGVIHIGF